MKKHQRVYKGIFTKVSDNTNAMRTKSMEGWSDELPTLGHSFIFTGKALTKGAYARMLLTSRVTKIVHELPQQSILFNTENSTYRFDYIIDEGPDARIFQPKEG
jgi:hypothetical protein